MSRSISFSKFGLLPQQDTRKKFKINGKQISAETDSRGQRNLSIPLCNICCTTKDNLKQQQKLNLYRNGNYYRITQ